MTVKATEMMRSKTSSFISYFSETSGNLISWPENLCKEKLLAQHCYENSWKDLTKPTNANQLLLLLLIRVITFAFDEKIKDGWLLCVERRSWLRRAFSSLVSLDGEEQIGEHCSALVWICFIALVLILVVIGGLFWMEIPCWELYIAFNIYIS